MVAPQVHRQDQPHKQLIPPLMTVAELRRSGSFRDEAAYLDSIIDLNIDTIKEFYPDSKGKKDAVESLFDSGHLKLSTDGRGRWGLVAWCGQSIGYLRIGKAIRA